MNTTKKIAEELITEAIAAYDRGDFEATKNIITPLVEQGHGRAQNCLATLYYYGQGVSKDIQRAIDLYRKSAESGSPQGQFNYGRLFDEGEDGFIERDYTQATEWYLKAAEQGDADAQFNLGRLYYFGHGVEKNYRIAADWYSKAAKQGDAMAQFQIGFMHYHGRVGEPDFKTALQWFLKSADQEDVNAQEYLGKMYYFGNGVNEDGQLASKWFFKAAEQGSSDAQFYLGAMNYDGKGVEQNYETALHWFRKAAEQGDADAQLNLGLMLRDGQGVEQDLQAASSWFEKAAEQGHAKSQYQLAKSYQQGLGVPQDDEQAAAWMLKAAKQGHAKAQFQLAQMYESGKGLVMDADKANFWYESAAQQGEKKPSVADLNEHLIVLNHLDRQRFGYVTLVENTGIPFLDAQTCFFHEVIDGQQRMPVAKVELENVIADYGTADSPNLNNEHYIPWLKRLIQFGDLNMVTSIRAVLIVCGDLVLTGADEVLVSQLSEARKQHGLDEALWGDEEVQLVIQLSKNEEARSIHEIEQRANIAKIIADQINSGNQEAPAEASPPN